MANKKITDMGVLSDADIDWDNDVAPVVDVNEPVAGQRNRKVPLKVLRPQPLGTGDTPNFAGLLIGGVDIATYLGISTVKDNLNADTEPTVDDDETEGYSVGSRWYDTGATPAVFVCLDATEGAAVWVESSIGIEDLGTAAVFNIGTGGATVPLNNALNYQKFLAFSLASSGSDSTIDWSQGSYHVREISEDTEFTFTNIPTDGPAMLVLRVKTVGTPKVTWDPALKYCAAIQPEPLEDACHVFYVHTADGVNLEIVGNYNLLLHESPTPPPPTTGGYYLFMAVAGIGAESTIVALAEKGFGAQLPTPPTINTVATLKGMKHGPGKRVLGARCIHISDSMALNFYEMDNEGVAAKIGSGQSITPLINSAIVWSPNGLHVAIAISGAIRVYAWDDSTGLGSLEATFTVSSSFEITNPVAVDWTHEGDGLFIAGVSNANGSYRTAAAMLPWNEATKTFGTPVLCTLPGSYTSTVGNNRAARHPTENIFAFGHYSSFTTAIAKWTGSGFDITTAGTSSQIGCNGRAWNDDGTRLVLGTQAADQLQLFSFDAETMTATKLDGYRHTDFNDDTGLSPSNSTVTDVVYVGNNRIVVAWGSSTNLTALFSIENDEITLLDVTALPRRNVINIFPVLDEE